MNMFQIIMLGISLYFAYQVYLHINTLQDPIKESKSRDRVSVIDPEYLVKKADDAYERGDYKDALKYLKDASAKDSQNRDILNKLGFIFAKEAQFQEAVDVYKESLKLDDTDDTVHNAIASVYRSLGEMDKAIEHYEKALSIDDRYAITYFNYGNLLVDMSQFDKAKEMYERAIKIDPDFTQAKFELEKLK